jgi:predicted nucleic acid-binding protein
MPGAVDGVVTVDTSVAVPLLLRNHEAHAVVIEWRKDRPLSVCGHAWIETYAVLTRLPTGTRLLPNDAVALLNANFSRPLSPKPSTLSKAPELFAAAGIAGGATYDGWVALAAVDNRTLLATRDVRAESTYRRLGADVDMIA